MNIELEEVVVMEVSDDALELAAGGAQGGNVGGVDCDVLFCATGYHIGCQNDY